MAPLLSFACSHFLRNSTAIAHRGVFFAFRASVRQPEVDSAHNARVLDSIESGWRFGLCPSPPVLPQPPLLPVLKPASRSSAPHKTPPRRPKTKPPRQDDVRSKLLPP